jgi:hypothetical protein
MSLDHVASAQALLDALNGQPVELAMSFSAAAQAHATLALVEQQRIANLIALASHANERWGNYAGEAGGLGTLFSYPDAEGGNMQVRDDIARALGIRSGAHA